VYRSLAISPSGAESTMLCQNWGWEGVQVVENFILGGEVYGVWIRSVSACKPSVRDYGEVFKV